MTNPEQKPDNIRSLENVIFKFSNKEDLEARLRIFVANVRGDNSGVPKSYYTDIIERIFAEAGYAKSQNAPTPVDGDVRRMPDWGWLTDILSAFDITEKRSMRKNAHDFTSLEANLYTEIQKRYTPRERPQYIPAPNGSHTSKAYEGSMRIHADQIATMDKMGYGLLLDGFTFYKKGYELEPWKYEMNFTMHHAYEIHAHLQAVVREAETRGHIEEWLALDKVVGFTKKRNKAVYKLQLPLEYVQRRTKELKTDLQQLNQGEK